MNIRCVAGNRLNDTEFSAWCTIQQSHAVLASPYFRPEYTQAVAEVRNDVEVAVVEDAGRPVAFLPFQRSRRNVARPVGGPLSDFHGLIKDAKVEIAMPEVLRQCGLTAWHFDSLVESSAALGPFVRKSDESPYIDVARGFDHYVATRPNGRRIEGEYRRKARKLARDFGPIRYELHQPSPHVVETLFQWKGRQFERTRALNIFRFAWVRHLLESLLRHKGEHFSPVVATMNAGDTLVAMNFGMRSRHVLHPWFIAYNVDVARYSPGFLHWIETMKAASGQGITRIDLGRGPEGYKRRLMSGVTPVAEGCVDVRPATALLRRATWRLRESIRNSVLCGPTRMPASAAYKLRTWLAVQ